MEDGDSRSSSPEMEVAPTSQSPASSGGCNRKMLHKDPFEILESFTKD